MSKKEKKVKEKKRRRHFGDRKDGVRLMDIDSMHVIMPLIYPSRADSEAYISETIDLTNINKWLAEHNYDGIDFKYTMFHLIVTAMLKTVYLRPKLNRFIKNKYLYQRNYISAGFTVKKIFSDESDEGLSFLYAKPDDSIFTVHESIKKTVTQVRSPKGNSTGDAMDTFNKIPRLLAKIGVNLVHILDKYGHVPNSFIADDPGHATIFLTNLGSIGLNCGYHHLSNWGTNSFFAVIGKKGIRPCYKEDGTFEMKEMVDLGLTIDERIADGYYYSRSVKLLKKLLENPELLEKPLSEEVEIDG